MKQLPPEVLLARMLLAMTVVPKLAMAPPPPGAELPEKVLLATVRVPPPWLLLLMAPPPLALLSEKVLLVTLSAPLLWIAPSPLLPEKVLLVTFRVPSLAMPPPGALAMVRFSTVNVRQGFTKPGVPTKNT